MGGTKMNENEKTLVGLAENVGMGFSESQVRNFRKFYLTFKKLQIQQTMPAEFKSRIFSISSATWTQLRMQYKRAGFIFQLVPIAHTLRAQLDWSNFYIS